MAAEAARDLAVELQAVPVAEGSPHRAFGILVPEEVREALRAQAAREELAPEREGPEQVARGPVDQVSADRVPVDRARVDRVRRDGASRGAEEAQAQVAREATEALEALEECFRRCRLPWLRSEVSGLIPDAGRLRRRCCVAPRGATPARRNSPLPRKKFAL